MHASAYRFGIAMEMTVEAIDEAMSEGDCKIGPRPLRRRLLVRGNCDDDLNPFIAQHWKAIDTTIAMDRILEQQKEAEEGKKRKATPAC
jgi:hypothetical protein